MLADKDRIFTNIYGFHDWGLEGAKKRGCWNGTKGFIEKGRDWMIMVSTLAIKLLLKF